MSIKLRLALLLGLLLLLFVFCLFAFRALEQRQISESIASARRDDAALLGNWLDLRTASLRRFTDDAAAWSDLATFTFRPTQDPTWPQRELHPLLAGYGVDALWILGSDGTVLYQHLREDLISLPPPVPEGRLDEHTAPGSDNRSYFHPTPPGLLEVRSCRIAGPNGNAWLFAARLWDEPYLRRLGELTDSSASLGPPAAASIADALKHTAEKTDAPAPIVVLRPLTGWSGVHIQTLRLVKPAPDISFYIATDRLKTRVFLFFGLCLIASLAVSLHRWILRPLGWITQSLARHDAAPIQPLLKARTELTRVAELIVSSFEHREELRREVAERRHAEQELQRTLEERARLGRDLHDGVIQSLYAAGLGLASARKKLGTDTQAAERHLGQIADLLNDTIRDVRDFITGLEPETLRDDGFLHTLQNIFAATNASGLARAEFDLDEPAVESLPLTLRTDLLLLLREAISNALRHGQARLVRIRIHRTSDQPPTLCLHVEDDGTGFDPARVKRGRGLDNLFARAATHGARTELHSAPGHGTRLAFHFTLPDPADDAASAPRPEPDLTQ
ncbi:MAG: histidine kinase [Opitutaceae bacterium]|jgi:signal transduction histidine kinase|nr:histidine kinase [Opitutaceae bacterium]